MTISSVRLSKTMAHALRHEPWLYELELDEDGWVPLDQLLEGLQRLGPEWAVVDRNAIEQVVAQGTKPRYESDHGRIRARYGHSTPGRIRRDTERPPDRLYHGTSPAALPRILKEGLKPMGRQYVHLSPDRETARQVGLRKARSCVVLLVDAAEAGRQGVTFYRGNAMVWLADTVPADHLALMPARDGLVLRPDER